jgi:hypothetical protein
MNEAKHLTVMRPLGLNPLAKHALAKGTGIEPIRSSSPSLRHGKRGKNLHFKLRSLATFLKPPLFGFFNFIVAASALAVYAKNAAGVFHFSCSLSFPARARRQEFIR